MTKKKITRKVSWAISLGWLFYITIKFLIGNVFEYLQAIHKERYKLYFTGDNRKKIEEYSAEIEEYGNAILDVCKEIITKNLLSKKHTKSVEKIFNQTKELMSTTN